jgi:polyisoprenoid-binding protein YceI
MHAAASRPKLAEVFGIITFIFYINFETVSDPSAKGRAVAFVATGTITRSEFGMTFGVPLIDDALEITVKTRALTDE